jgi:hypothetical protein
MTLSRTLLRSTLSMVLCYACGREHQDKNPLLLTLPVDERFVASALPAANPEPR